MNAFPQFNQLSLFLLNIFSNIPIHTNFHISKLILIMLQTIEINKLIIFCFFLNNMFKPSLKKSVLNNNLCFTTQTKTDPFGIPTVQKPKPIHRFVDTITTSPQTSLPSMMIPQQILQKHEFRNQNNYTHIFTPLSYDFKPYPAKVKQIISANPKAAQVGRINQVNYVVFGETLLLWRSINNGQEQNMLKIHKFKQVINIAAFSVIKNQKMFKKERVTVLAVSFENRVKLFKLDQAQLNIQDLMIKYQVKSCRYIQKIHFTQENEIVIAGDSGQFSMISLNGNKQLIVKVKSSIIKKYLSKSAFDYSTRHIIREIQVSQKFLYCLHDRISKSNYLMYLLKKTVNKMVMLSEEPKHIYEETFVDVYKFANGQRSEIVFQTQLKQNEIEKKIKEGYVNFWGEGVKDGFRIVSISCKGQQTSMPMDKGKLEDSKQKSSSQQKLTKSIQKSSQLVNPLIEVTTKCGYVVSLIHDNIARDGSSNDKDNFSFATQPTKIPSKIGQASLFEPKVFMSAPQQKQYRKSYVIKSLSVSKDQKLTLLNDSLMLNNKQGLSLIRFNDLKLSIYDTTTQEQAYISQEEFNKIYQPYKLKSSQSQQSLFGQRATVYNQQEHLSGNKYYRLFNNQKRWTCFDNQGRFHIHPLQVKHILLSYLYYQCEFTNQHNKTPSQPDQDTHFLIESDLRLHSVIEKIIRLYGYSTFMTALVEILVNNSNDQREYFYIQRDLFVEVVKRDFQYELANSFEDWSYSLAQHNPAQRILPTDKMLQFLWIILFQHQNKPILTSQTILTQNPTSEYAQKAKHYQQAKNQLQYTAYGYALKAKFSEIIQILIYFRAKQFKPKQKQLKQCQLKLVQFFNFLETKRVKSETQEYKHYLDMKLSNLSRKKQLNPPQHYPKNLNTTLSTTLNTTHQSFTAIDQQIDTGSLKRGITQQANQTLEKYIHKSIQKIISLIDVMNILIEKDQRQGLPNFIEIVTNFKNQIKIGAEFFKEELFFSPNTVEFIHPQFVKQVEVTLPELQLQTKIDFLKFKLAKNIAISNSLTEVDLKSLNFDKLSELVTSSELPEVKKMFLGQAKDLSFQKTYFYAQFLSISLAKLIQKVKQLSTLKQQKFNSLSEEGNLTKKKVSSLATHLTVEKIIMSQQQLEYYQEEMGKLFQEIKAVFASSVKALRTINGPQYYEAESYLDRMIELLTTNFGTQQIMVQTIEIILKDANFFEKVHYMRQIKDRIMHLKESDVQILKISKEKETKLEEKSTFQYLMDTQNKKSLAQERTYDTLNSGSMR